MFKQRLQEGEEPLLLLRQHPATFIWPLMRSLIIVAIPAVFTRFFFMYNWSTIIYFALIVFGIALLLYSWMAWYFVVTLVTDKRILSLNQRGIFTKEVREMTYDKISEVNFIIKGLSATMFKYGDVRIFVQDVEKPVVIKSVKEPEIIKDKIAKIIEVTDSSNEEMSAKELIEYIQKIKK